MHPDGSTPSVIKPGNAGHPMAEIRELHTEVGNVRYRLVVRKVQIPVRILIAAVCVIDGKSSGDVDYERNCILYLFNNCFAVIL